MNLFRSEEHARRWTGYRPGTEGGLLSLAQAMSIMSTPRFRERLNGHYVSSAPGYAPALFAHIREVTHSAPFWEPPVPPAPTPPAG